ncbi:MAG: hypothetical protein IKO39_09405 [Treponema sp.]|nr:hypothetical protein [Treponema sp.]
MDIFFLFLASVIIIFMLMLYLKFKKVESKNNRKESNLRTQKDENGKTDFVRCPLCSSPLAKNEDMFSRIYRPMTTADQRMTVHGCPHCYPRPEPGVKRSCPVCGKEVPLDGELIARLFNRTEGKKHVMITGCSVCYKVRS